MEFQELLKAGGLGVVGLLLLLAWLLMSRKIVPGAYADKQIELERENAEKWRTRYIELLGEYSKLVQTAGRGVAVAEKIVSEKSP